jgi:hypothetical protein
MIFGRFLEGFAQCVAGSPATVFNHKTPVIKMTLRPEPEFMAVMRNESPGKVLFCAGDFPLVTVMRKNP